MTLLKAGGIFSRKQEKSFSLARWKSDGKKKVGMIKRKRRALEQLSHWEWRVYCSISVYFVINLLRISVVLLATNLSSSLDAACDFSELNQIEFTWCIFLICPFYAFPFLSFLICNFNSQFYFPYECQSAFCLRFGFLLKLWFVPCDGLLPSWDPGVLTDRLIRLLLQNFSLVSI